MGTGLYGIMAYNQFTVVFGGLVHIPVVIGLFKAFDTLTGKNYKAQQALAKAEAEAKAKQEAEAKAAALAAEQAKAKAEAAAKAKAEAEAKAQADKNDSSENE